MRDQPHRRKFWIGITGLLLLTFALRVAGLTVAPPGLTHDEASNGHDSAAILRGVHHLYFPVGYGHEPLYNYSVAALTLLLGQSIFTLRLTTVLWSLATWTLTVVLARRWWGRRAALFAGAALAVSFWAQMMGRVGLRAPTLPALLAASALAYDHAVRGKRAWIGYGLAGLALGASFYTYMASRGMLLWHLALLIVLAALNRATLRSIWKGTVAVVFIAGLIGLPLALHLRANPELETRIEQLGGALTAARAGDFAPLWGNITASLPMLLWRADPRWLYNIAERPALEPLLAILFLIGVGIALRRLRDWRYAFLLLWLGGGLAPAFLAPVEYNTLRAIGALPAIFLLIALGCDTLWSEMRRRFPALTATRLLALCGAGLLITGGEMAHAYFARWAHHPDVRVIYHHHVVALGHHLDASPAQTPVVITSIYPGEFHDPYTMEVTLRREDLTLRWADGRGALFFPRGESRLYTDTLAPLSPPLRALMDSEETLAPAATLNFRPDDLHATLPGYRWDADAGWAAALAAMRKDARAALHDGPPSPYHPAVALPISYADVVDLVGYQVTPPVAAPGATVDVITAWEVRAPHPEALTLFSHLVDAENELVTQVDRLDAPAWQWQAGDRFVQHHRYTLPEDLAPGDYGFAVGFYRQEDFVRLPLALPNDNLTRVLLPFDVVREP
ncbi:MAG: glycosyltransferase family 39 protein [Anaerolineales bacterium]